MALLCRALAVRLEAAPALQAATGAQTLVVLPFENESNAPGLEWISEAFERFPAQPPGDERSQRFFLAWFSDMGHECPRESQLPPGREQWRPQQLER